MVQTIKISQLAPIKELDLSIEIPAVNIQLTGEKKTSNLTVGELKSLLDIENGYDTLAEAMANTTTSQIFHVYLDASHKAAYRFIRSAYGSNQIIDDAGNNLIVYSSSITPDIIVKVNSFTDLRNFKPWYDGQVVELVGYYSGSFLGGGRFVARLNTGTDDSGTVAAGSGYYWQRIGLSYVSPEMFGAKSDGVADDSAAILQSLVVAKVMKLPVVLQPRVYIYNSSTSLEVDLCNISFISPFGRAKIDFTNCTAAVAIKIYSTGVYPDGMYQNTTNKVSGIEFVGGLIAGRDGLQIGHPTYDYNGQCIIENCTFVRFDNVIVCTTNTWRYKFVNCTISTGISHVFYAALGLANSGESITFRDCQISDSNGAPFTIACNNFTVGCSGTSILNTLIEISGGASTLFVDGAGNNENPGKTAYFQYANITGSSARLVLTNISININQPAAQTKPVFYVAANAHIEFGNVEFPGNAYVFEQLSTDGVRAFVEGPGTIKCNSCSYQLNSGGGCIPIHGSLNAIYNSGFETGDTSGWAVNTQSSPSQSAVVSTTSKKNGVYGIRLTSANTNSCFISQYISVIPGRQFATSLNAKVVTAASDAGVVGNISLQFFSSGGPLVAGTAIKSFTANFPLVVGDWAVLGAYLRGIVPPGAAYAQVSIQSRYGAVLDLDDILINFI